MENILDRVGADYSVTHTHEQYITLRGPICECRVTGPGHAAPLRSLAESLQHKDVDVVHPLVVDVCAVRPQLSRVLPTARGGATRTWRAARCVLPRETAHRRRRRQRSRRRRQWPVLLQRAPRDGQRREHHRRRQGLRGWRRRRQRQRVCDAHVGSAEPRVAPRALHRERRAPLRRVRCDPTIARYNARPPTLWKPNSAARAYTSAAAASRASCAPPLPSRTWRPRFCPPRGCAPANAPPVPFDHRR